MKWGLGMGGVEVARGWSRSGVEWRAVEVASGLGEGRALEGREFQPERGRESGIAEDLVCGKPAETDRLEIQEPFTLGRGFGVGSSGGGRTGHSKL